MVAIAPLSMGELRAVDDNFAQLDARPGRNDLGNNVDAGIEAEDEAGVAPIGNEVSTGEQHLTGGRHGTRGVFRGDHTVMIL